MLVDCRLMMRKHQSDKIDIAIAGSLNRSHGHVHLSMSRFQKATGALEFHPKDVVADPRKEPKRKSLAIVSFSRGIFTSTANLSKVRLSGRARRKVVESL
jgi:hypothetical protein